MSAPATMTLAELQRLIADSKGEWEHIEFKKTTGELHGGMETLCGFLNGSGGKVLFGVSTAGKVQGQDVSDPTFQEVANAIAQEDFSKVCFVGSGVLRAVALESALKLLELTAGKITTVSESTLGLRHGPMSALDQNTVFVSFLSQDLHRRKYELDLIEEVRRKRLVKLLVVVAPESTNQLDRLADHVLSLNTPDLADEYRAPVDVILAQLLGLFCSLRLGLQPDCPSPNGAISRVVSHVNIY